jgi:hypothetical protein
MRTELITAQVLQNLCEIRSDDSLKFKFKKKRKKRKKKKKEEKKR